MGVRLDHRNKPKMAFAEPLATVSCVATSLLELSEMRQRSHRSSLTVFCLTVFCLPAFCLTAFCLTAFCLTAFCR